MQLPTTGNCDSPNTGPQWWRQSRRLFWLWKCLLNLSVTLRQWRKEGWKLVRVVTSFQEWAAILTAPIAHIFFSYGMFYLPVFIARCRNCFFPASLQVFYLWNINPWSFSVGEPPVNVEVTFSPDLGTAVLGVQCWTGWHTWLGAPGAPQAWEILFLGTVGNWKCWGARRGWNGHHMMGGNVRLSSAVGKSPAHCEHPGLFFLFLPCSPSLAFGLALQLFEFCPAHGRHMPVSGL